MRQLASQLKEEGFVFPDYKNSNMEILKEITTGRSNRIGEKGKKLFMVVDGLGYNLLKKLMSESNALQVPGNPEISSISTIFPSTTPAVIASIESGTPPSEHGINGWQVYYKEIGAISVPFNDSLALSKSFRLSSIGVNPIFPEPKQLINIAKKKRILVQYAESVKKSYEDKIGNVVHKSHAQHLDMFLSLRKVIMNDDYGFIYAYHDMIDHLQHVYGHSTEEVKHSVNSFFHDMEKFLLPALKKSDYNLIITADHGQIEQSKMIKIRFDDPIMDSLLMPPWGDSRIRYLHVARGMEERFEKQFEKRYSRYAMLIDSESAIRSGIFGGRKVKDNIRARFGTHFMLLKGRNTFEYGYPVPESARHHVHTGYHSGLSEDEMRVPLIVY